jgi:hypothetical protein
LENGHCEDPRRWKVKSKMDGREVDFGDDVNVTDSGLYPRLVFLLQILKLRILYQRVSIFEE